MKSLKIIMLLLGIILYTFKVVNGQSTSSGFSGTPNQPNTAGVDYLGWDNTVNVPLMIRHDNNQDINFYTGLTGGGAPIQRMTILGTAATNPGYVGIGLGLTPGWQLDVNSEINIDNPTFNIGTGSFGIGSYMLGGQTILTVLDGDNLLLGFGAGLNNAAGIQNIYIGNEAGRDNIWTQANTFMGFNAGMTHVGNGGNTFLG